MVSSLTQGNKQQPSFQQQETNSVEGFLTKLQPDLFDQDVNSF